MEKLCEICGEEYEASRSNQKYCPKCRKNPASAMKMYDIAQAMLMRHARPDLDRVYECVCENCGKTFKFGRTAKFCSIACKEDYYIQTSTCSYCGKNLIDFGIKVRNPGSTHYCSDECREKASWRLAERTGRITTCPGCGKAFANLHDRKYCSRACYQNWIQNRKKIVHTSTCEHCGKKFIVRDPEHPNRFCSRECYNAERKEQKDFLYTEEAVCSVCHKAFKRTKGSTRTYCSDACAKEIKARQKRIKKEEKRNLEKQAEIAKHGLCFACKTSYKDCERMKSNFVYSPKGAIFQNGKIISCPKHS